MAAAFRKGGAEGGEQPAAGAAARPGQEIFGPRQIGPGQGRGNSRFAEIPGDPRTQSNISDPETFERGRPPTPEFPTWAKAREASLPLDQVPCCLGGGPGCDRIASARNSAGRTKPFLANSGKKRATARLRRNGAPRAPPSRSLLLHSDGGAPHLLDARALLHAWVRGDPDDERGVDRREHRAPNIIAAPHTTPRRGGRRVCVDFICSNLGAAKFPGSTYATRTDGDQRRAPHSEMKP